MPLLVIPLTPAEAHLLTLGELDLLAARDLVLFERPDHPLITRLRSLGVKAGPFDDEPEAQRDDHALIVDPDSPRLRELARAGAQVSLTGPDALSAAHAAPVFRSAVKALGDLVAIMARLRSEDGCPWDLEQTHASLEVHLLEEVYEVIEAIDRGDVGKELEEELGDVLLQVAFHARLAEQEDRFDIAGVAGAISAKLVRRHPHVFADVEVDGASEVIRNWESIKAKEKNRADVFEGIPAGLPALLGAYKTQKRAASLGFHPDEAEARLKAGELLAGELDETTLGEALLWLVCLARAAGVEPEGALRSATARFRAERLGPDITTGADVERVKR